MILLDTNEKIYSENNLEKLFLDIDSLMSENIVDNGKILEIMGNIHKMCKLPEKFILDCCKKGKVPELIGAQSYIIFSGRNFFSRINLWFPLPKQGVNERYRRYLSIEENHNHNYDLYTICLHGSGYESTFYQSRIDLPTLNVGEKVQLKALGKKAIRQGEALFMEKNNIFHLQHWPESFSITLNVIANEKERFPQYVLERDLTVKSIIANM